VGQRARSLPRTDDRPSADLPRGSLRPGAGWRALVAWAILAHMAIEPGRRIRVVIAEDHPLYRDGLVRAISSDPQLELIREAPDGLEAERLIAETEPDV